MILLGHHAEGFLQIEIFGQPFPDGPAEHVIAFIAGSLALLLMLYGGFAIVRDLRHWRQRVALQKPG